MLQFHKPPFVYSTVTEKEDDERVSCDVIRPPLIVFILFSPCDLETFLASDSTSTTCSRASLYNDSSPSHSPLT
jgi:hypothetical protein